MKNRLLFAASLLLFLLGIAVSCHKTPFEENLIPVTFSFDYYGQEFAVPVADSLDFRIESVSDWIHPSEAPVDGTLSIHIDENDTKESREGKIIIHTDNQIMSYLVIQFATASTPDTKERIKESVRMGRDVAKAVQSLLASFSRNTPATLIAAAIEELDDVITAQADEEGEYIRYMKRDSTFTTVVLHPERYGIDPNKTDRSTRSTLKPATDNKHTNALTTKSALLLLPFYSSYIIDDEEVGLRQIDYVWLKQQLNDVGVHLDFYLDGNADLSKFRGDFLAKYDLILVISHGGSWTSTDGDNSVAPYTVCSTGTSADDEWPDSMDPGLYKRLETVLMSTHNRYVITDDFLKMTLGDRRFSSSFVYMGICSGLKNRDFRDFFMRNNASAYSGYSDEVGSYFAQEVLYSLCRSLSKGMTVGKALNYVERDPALQTVAVQRSINKFSGRFFFDINEAKFRTTLVDPTPYGLEQYVDGNQVVLKWAVPNTTGTYRYVVTLDDMEHSAGADCTLRLPAGSPGKHEWTVRADLYIGDDLIDSYHTDESGEYTVMDTPYFTVTTGDPIYVLQESATVPISYDTNQDLHVFYGGVVYSFERSEPALGRAYCQFSTDPAESNPFRVRIEPLLPGTKYYARGYIVTGESAITPEMQRKVQYGNVIEFETLPDASYPTFSGLKVLDEYLQEVSSLAFGPVDLGQTASLKLYLMNETMHDIPIKVRSISEGFHINLESEEIIHSDNGIAPVITFNPTQGKDYSGSVVFDLGEFYYPVEVKLSGTGVPLKGELSFSTSSIKFGSVEVGKKAHLPVVISNTGKQTAFITRVSLPDDGFNSTFNDPLPIAKGADATIEIVFVPTEARYYSGDVIFYTDTDESGFKIAVDGTGMVSTVSVTGVSLDRTELTLIVGGEQALEATVYPTNATNKDVHWKSSDPAVATVDDHGVVTALKPGPATVTVTTADGAHTASCLVSVKQVDGQHEGTVGEEWDY